jgi:hypothetical protein
MALTDTPASNFPGQLLFVAILGTALAVVTSVLVLRLYRRAVLRSMNASSRGGPAAVREAPVAAANPPAGSLAFEVVDTAAAPPRSELLHQAWTRPWRTAAAYALGGAAFAATMIPVLLISAGEGEFPPGRVAVLFAAFAWPIAITVSLVAGSVPATRRRTIAAYFAIYAVIAAWAAARNDRPFVEIAGLWLLLNGIPTLFLYTLLMRRCRS